MRTLFKVAVAVLITIIIVSVGAYAYLSMPKEENPPPTPTTYTLTIRTSPNGTTTPPSGSYMYAPNSAVGLIATPNDGYKFDYWLIDSSVNSTNPLTLNVIADVDVDPVFTLVSQPPPTMYTVTIEASPNGTTNPSAGSYSFVSGSLLTITATPNSGYQFDNWIIDGTTSLTNPLTKTVAADLSVSPVFSAIPPSPESLIVSSTTSLYETGVENLAIKPAFEAKYPWITVNFLAQGTGAAIQTAMRGDADMIMVHDPSQEKTFLANGYGVNRKIIGYNFFIMVGPKNDPANITGMTPIAAMQKIYTLGQSSQAIWVSRGDGSGTNSKEKSLWAAAGINWTQIRTQTWWYKETGQGMTATLVVANYLGGYTIADEASYLTNQNAKNIDMKVVVQADKDLLNVYSCVIDNPQNVNLTKTNFDASMLFVQFMVSPEGQQILADYGKATFGKPLFSPFVPLASNPSQNATLLGWIENYAYIPANETECPTQYRYNASDLYSPFYDSVSNTSLPTITLSPYVPGDAKTQMLTSYQEYAVAQTSVHNDASAVNA